MNIIELILSLHAVKIKTKIIQYCFSSFVIGLTLPLVVHCQPVPESSAMKIQVNKVNLFDVYDPGIRTGLLYDLETNEVVWGKDINYAYPIASLTKMMVALLVLEDVQNCSADWNDRLEMRTTRVNYVKRKKVYRTITSSYSLDAMLHLAMIASHNEACNVIAFHLAGSVEAFVERMNERAESLEMTNTFFSNPNGLPAVQAKYDNSSSAHDILILTLELLKYPELLAITKIGYDEIESDRGSSLFRNHNRLVIDFENEVDGLKTGFTRNARYCLAATANKNDRRLIAIAIGAPTRVARNDFVAGLFSSYYDYLKIGRLGLSDSEYLAYLDRKSGINSKDSVSNLPAGLKTVMKTVWSRERIHHTVRAGETLSSIGNKFGCSVTSLKKWNRLRNSTIIKGQKLVVYTLVKKQIEVEEEMLQPGDSDEDLPDSTAAESSNKIWQSSNEQSQNELYYVVKPGDTLWSISKQFDGISIQDLRNWNELQKTSVLKPGMKLKISNGS
ncbi:MAG: LysM peptidoglycan-binding domain-containing protein [Bacteroidia bacterium]|nr:LysM peptidoglycan-binding domain-containing protein [Bacteroidia bacterium]MCZ2277885.1 LysM peptidoglycan-binding domain-containing protein [Bacteroidia bacterium]